MKSGVCPAFKNKGKIMLQTNNYGVDILVNGNHCKQYEHEGKLYVEAKEGSEYEISIKNNLWSRVMAVVSVDGLNVLNGESSKPEDDGYIVNGYGSVKIKGFRYNNEKVGAFKFSLKDSQKSNTYAASKGCTKNCGVIGVLLYSEYYQPVITSTYYPSNPQYPTWYYTSGGDTWCGEVSGVTTTDADFHDSNTTKGLSGTSNASITQTMNFCSVQNSGGGAGNLRSMNMSIPVQDNVKGFDIGTEWGQSKDSKVVVTSFNVGSLTFSKDIYYASRESLIQMGVQLKKDVSVAFPKSFESKYATPPKGWKE